MKLLFQAKQLLPLYISITCYILWICLEGQKRNEENAEWLKIVPINPLCDMIRTCEMQFTQKSNAKRFSGQEDSNLRNFSWAGSVRIPDNIRGQNRNFYFQPQKYSVFNPWTINFPTGLPTKQNWHWIITYWVKYYVFACIGYF